MADLYALKTELADDPLTRGYAGMSDAAAATDINTVYRTRIKGNLTGDEIFGATDAAEFASLQVSVRRDWVAFCARDIINPAGTANVAFVEWVFGNPSDTRTNLLALRQEPISRGVELGLGRVKVGHVQEARL